MAKMPTFRMVSHYMNVVFCSLLAFSSATFEGVQEMDMSSAETFKIGPEGVNHKAGNRNFSFASYYGDHMVLQAAPRKAVIWGYAPDGSQGVTVQVLLKPDDVKYTTVVTDNLLWNVTIGPVAVGGPRTVTALLGADNITLSDVMFGDVWVCSGQSNMQFQLSEIFNSTEEILDALNYTNIRVFIVARVESNTPLSDLKGIQLPWTRPVLSDEFAMFSAVCWLYGKYLYQQLKKPLGLVETIWGGTPVESWSSPDVLHKCGLTESDSYWLARDEVTVTEYNLKYDKDPSLQSHSGFIDALDNTPQPKANSVLWNAMVHPLLNMTIYGAIWYQGEANSNYHTAYYNCTFPAMIDDWRKMFYISSGTDNLFPFGFVQLAGYNPDYQTTVGFPDVRWHQTADYGYVPNHRQRNVFMAVAMDLPDFLSPKGPVHPRDKQDVAARLVRGGLAIAYKQNISYQGPYPVKVSISQEEPYNYTQVEVEYTMGLEQRWLDGFEICCSFVSKPACAPGKSWWLPTATMQAYHRANVTESYAPQCDPDKVMGIRYAWRETPCPFKRCAIYGASNGLPMPPFTYFGEEFKKVFKRHGKYEVQLGK